MNYDLNEVQEWENDSLAILTCTELVCAPKTTESSAEFRAAICSRRTFWHLQLERGRILEPLRLELGEPPLCETTGTQQRTANDSSATGTRGDLFLMNGDCK